METKKLPVCLVVDALNNLWEGNSLIHVDDKYHFVSADYYSKKFYFVIHKINREILYFSKKKDKALSFFEQLRVSSN